MNFLERNMMKIFLMIVTILELFVMDSLGMSLAFWICYGIYKAETI